MSSRLFPKIVITAIVVPILLIGAVSCSHPDVKKEEAEEYVGGIVVGGFWAMVNYDYVEVTFQAYEAEEDSLKKREIKHSELVFPAVEFGVEICPLPDLPPWCDAESNELTMYGKGIEVGVLYVALNPEESMSFCRRLEDKVQRREKAGLPFWEEFIVRAANWNRDVRPELLPDDPGPSYLPDIELVDFG